MSKPDDYVNEFVPECTKNCDDGSKIKYVAGVGVYVVDARSGYENRILNSNSMHLAPVLLDLLGVPKRDKPAETFKRHGWKYDEEEKEWAKEGVECWVSVTGDNVWTSDKDGCVCLGPIDLNKFLEVLG